MPDGVRPDTPVDVRAARLVAAAVADETVSGSAAVLQRVCRAAVEAFSLRGSVVHVVGSGDASGVIASSDPASVPVADLSFTTGEGPGVEAVRRRRPVLVGDLARDQHRWPGFTQAALEMDVRAIFCLPLHVGGVVLGVLEVYASRARTLDDDETSLALAFSRLATQTLLGDRTVGHDGVWQPLLDHRAEVHQAQGMVMVDLGVDLAEALLRMRAHAFTQGLPLIEVAHAIIAGFVLPAAEAGES
jgi:GAF domain/ANTAR domain